MPSTCYTIFYCQREKALQSGKFVVFCVYLLNKKYSILLVFLAAINCTAVKYYLVVCYSPAEGTISLLFSRINIFWSV